MTVKEASAVSSTSFAALGTIAAPPYAAAAGAASASAVAAAGAASSSSPLLKSLRGSSSLMVQPLESARRNAAMATVVLPSAVRPACRVKGEG